MLVLTSSDVWAPTRELAFGRYPLRSGWTQVRRYGAGTSWSLTESASGRSRWSEETRPDSDWYPQGRKRRITQSIREFLQY